MVKAATPVRHETGAMATHIARVAARLFAAQGYDATPVRAIVEAAGVTKPTLYYHFGSKEGLAHALLTVPMTRLVEALRGLVERGGDPVPALEGLIEANFAFCRDDPDRARFVYALFFGPLGSGLSAELARFGEELTVQMGRAVDRIAEAGVIDPARAAACTAALRGLIVIHTMDFLYRGDNLGPGLPKRLVSDLLRGFGSREVVRKRTPAAPARGRARAAAKT
jgi:AcrR family transcriptional regulator